MLILIIGLRHHVGCDWGSYYKAFLDIQNKDLWTAVTNTSGIDPGYGALNWFAGRAGLDIWAVNLTCAAIFTWGLLKLCRIQPNPPLAMLVAIPYLVIVVAMGYTRQAAALGLVMYAISQLESRSFVKVGLSLLVAAIFHKSAIVVIPLFAIAAARRTALTFLLFIPPTIIGYRFLLAGSVNELMQNYVEAGYSSSGATVRVLMNVAPALIYIAFIRKFQFGPKQRLFWLALSIASLAALGALRLTSSSTAVDRVALYFIPLQIAVLSRIPSAFGTVERQNNFLLTAVIIYSLAVAMVWLNFGQFSRCWIPYRMYPFS